MPRRAAVLVIACSAARTLSAAVESVLCGSHPCRVFVVDDASDVPVANVLPTYGGRVEIIRLVHRVGPAAARNVGFARILAEGYDYVAIQDADDLSYADRLATQVAFLDTHPDVGAVGGYTRFIDERICAATVRNFPRVDADIRRESAMFRTSTLREIGICSNEYPAADDDELLRRVGARFALANVPELLVARGIAPQPQQQLRLH